MQAEQAKAGAEVAMKVGNWAQRNPLALAFVVMLISIGGTWTTMQGRIKDKDGACDKITAGKDSVIIAQQRVIAQKDVEISEWKYYAVPNLHKIKDQVEETKQIADTLYSNYLKNNKR